MKVKNKKIIQNCYTTKLDIDAWLMIIANLATAFIQEG